MKKTILTCVFAVSLFLSVFASNSTLEKEALSYECWDQANGWLAYELSFYDSPFNNHLEYPDYETQHEIWLEAYDDCVG